MKRVSLRAVAFCLILLLPFAFSSCNNTDGEVLLGRWETEMTDEELGEFTIVYHFTDEGEIFIEQKQGDVIPFSIPFGTWSVKGNEVTIESDGLQKSYLFTATESELTLISEEGENTVFHRI